ncbi:Imidazoleglycerol-phosphate dehydratase [Candidatus Vidania fulgoroideae]|uniref:Imidazoleglycerol-phosphate dehydratase n=1 Tax=Candidatus Vidania fulgoroideorum TaxID=881286 RepID=A0A346E0H9_9PROT|nr:Imidazoleglycerol-phosphate dehydratase [Candidatus Vidania fulgoroideae]WDI79434.1 imidazoleglycerol-phosphate dehydratase [Candidatus Vidania fulgoroideae]WDR79181.1 imidazoleglycerol-phosphate dehydratase [Candidatus Vidania fulgoroideae]
MKKIKLKRKTRETYIKISLINKKFPNIQTGIGFFNHMLEQFSFNSKFILNILAKGDLKVDQHHTVEDIGIVLGKLFRKIKKFVKERYVNAFVAMDESITNFIIDVSGRGNVFFNFKLKKNLKNFNSDLVFEFFKAFSINSKYTIHINNYGNNMHHRIESIFKAFGVAIKKIFNKKNSNIINSTKFII